MLENVLMDVWVCDNVLGEFDSCDVLFLFDIVK